MMPGETILSGAASTCDECGIKPQLKVCESVAGWYVGAYCCCGPYSRESDYFVSKVEAERALPGFKAALADEVVVPMAVRR